MNWLIFYGNGSTFSSTDGAWEDAPSRDVQVILFDDPKRGWIMRHGANTRKGDFFRLDKDGTVVGMDFTGVLDHVVHVLGVIKEGRMLSQDDWDEVLKRAVLTLRDLQDGSTKHSEH